MEKKKRIILHWAMILCLAVAPVQSDYYSKNVAAVHKKEKVTHLCFFLHHILSGKGPRAVMVALLNFTNDSSSPTPFGSVFAIDYPLRVGTEPTSEEIGNAQGLYLSSSQNYSKFTIAMYIDFAFTTGMFNGSSFGVFSRNPVTEGDREVAIVGGRGKFRTAGGYAKIKTSYFKATTGDAILEYEAVVYH